ncbi:MAG TPA: biotin/lipoyl-containing protein [Pyrinomonadaceae bacterium]|nr:biotin/lipoyl-containing protein [Pyrinomonadaceae bacterium]
MKLVVEIAGELREVELTRDGREVRASVDDREYVLDASEPEPGVFLLKHEGRVYEAFVSSTGEVNVGGFALESNVIDPKRLRGSAVSGDHDHGHAEIRSAMPGKVVRILKASGDAVAKGDGVVVVEAMKMQNELKSPRDGTIGTIKVSEGDTVSTGDVLVVID